MLNWLKTYWPAVLIALLMLAVVDGTFSSLLTCHPISAESGGSADQRPTHDECSALHGPILVSLRWLLHGLHKYEGVFTALFTVVLAVFTGRLWFSTEKLWGVTLRSAETAERALTQLEAPFISIKIVQSGIGKSYSTIGGSDTFDTLSFVIVNFGRTPARIIEVADKFGFVENNKGLPPEVNPAFASRNSIPYGVIAPPQGESEGWTQNIFAFMLKYVAEGPPPPLQKGVIFFYGFVRYATIFNEVFRVGFCFMFDIESEKWILTGGDRHNYHRKETEFYPAPMY